jgi:isopenicillin N synthase-like dioxygenase
MEMSNANIPVIDVSPSNPDAPNQLLSAASKYGFVFIENSPEAGIPPQQIAEMFELSKIFFAAPTEVKEEVSIGSNKAGKNHGWLSQGIEKLDPKTQKRADAKEYDWNTIELCCCMSHTNDPLEHSTWGPLSQITPSTNPFHPH